MLLSCLGFSNIVTETPDNGGDPLSAGLMTTSDIATRCMLEKGEGHPLLSCEIVTSSSWWCSLGAFVDCLDVGLQGRLPVNMGSPCSSSFLV